MTTSVLLAWGALFALSGAIGALAWALGMNGSVTPPDVGLRGYERHAALRESSLFRMLEPAIRKIGGWFGALPLGKVRTRAQQRLWNAGDYMGLCADEWFAIAAMAAVAGAGVGIVVMRMMELSWLFIPVLGGFGAFLAWNSVSEAIVIRRGRVSRGLPSTIDLLALCISAGMTFPQALADVVSQSEPRDPLTKELRHILRQLDLGHSRSHALMEFAERIPIEAVLDFTAAVTQAEARGTPIKDVLKTQATMLRMRRTVQVEEEAAAAGVKLTLPLAMMLVTVLVLIGAPMLLRASAFLS